MSTLRRWREYVRQYGVWGLVSHIALRAVRPFWELSSLAIFVHEGSVQPTKARVELRIGLLTADAASGVPRSENDWQRRWDQGDVCYAAWVDEACVHTSWVSRTGAPIGEVRQWLELGTDEAYIYDCYTDGNHRGKRVFPAVLSAILQGLSADGVAKVWIAVETQNVSSARAIQAAGFVEVGKVEYRRFGQSEQLNHHVLSNRRWPRFRAAGTRAE